MFAFGVNIIYAYINTVISLVRLVRILTLNNNNESYSFLIAFSKNKLKVLHRPCNTENKLRIA